MIWQFLIGREKNCTIIWWIYITEKRGNNGKYRPSFSADTIGGKSIDRMEQWGSIEIITAFHSVSTTLPRERQSRIETLRSNLTYYAENSRRNCDIIRQLNANVKNKYEK